MAKSITKGTPIGNLLLVSPYRSTVEKFYHECSTTMAKAQVLAIHIVSFKELGVAVTMTPVSGGASGREAWQQPRPEHDPLEASCRFPMRFELQEARSSKIPLAPVEVLTSNLNTLG